MRLLGSIFLASVAMCTSQAYADAPAKPDNAAKDHDMGVPDIIVTAQKRETKLQDTPITVAVVSGDEILKDARTKLDDILVNTPGIEVQGVARGMVVNIRGLGLNLPPQNGAAAVATNYDGAYNARGEAGSTGFYDLERVETLSGPQSTIYGRNAVGGVVNILSHEPMLGTLGGYAQAEVGNYSFVRGEGAINLPIGQTLSLRVAGAGVSRDGYLSNGHDDNKASSMRAKLLYDANQGVSMLIGYEQTTLGGKGPGAVPDASYQTGSLYTTDPSEGFQHHIARKYWAIFKAEVGPGNLIIEPSYQTLHGHVVGSFGGIFVNDYDPQLSNQFALEARYSSKAGSKVAWDVGYYHYNYKISGPNDVSGACYAPGTGVGQGVVYNPAAGLSNEAAGPPGTPCSVASYASDFTGQAIGTTNVDSAFGQVVVPLVSGLKVTLGGRESWVTTGGSYDANANNTFGYNGGTPVTAPDNLALPTVHTSYFDYRFSLEDKLTANSLLYATIASGHREGGYGFGTASGFGPSGFVPGAPPLAYAPESMVDYEIGIKNTLFNGRLLLNADAFYYDYKSYQLVLVTFTNGFAVNFDTFPAREYGAEGSFAFAITPVDKISGSITYLNSALKCSGVNGCAYAGEPFTFAPRRAIKAEYSHEFDLGSSGKINAHANIRAISSQLVTANDPAAMVNANDMQAPYVTGDAFLGWASLDKRYSVTGYVKNVNNKLIKASEFFGFEQVQMPRSFGVTAKASF